MAKAWPAWWRRAHLALQNSQLQHSGLTSDLIAATTYARLRGVPIMNMSLQSYPFSSTLSTEFTSCQNAGIVLCICAGNQGVNNDTTPNYPSSYTHTNIIAVGNQDRTDVRYTGFKLWPHQRGPVCARREHHQCGVRRELLHLHRHLAGHAFMSPQCVPP